jgi:hypothetical protein
MQSNQANGTDTIWEAVMNTFIDQLSEEGAETTQLTR